MKTLANTDDTIFSSLTLSNGTSFVTLSAPPTGIYILLLPPNLGSPGAVLTTTGSGETYWATAAASNYITSVDSDFLVTGGQLSSPTITDINQRVITTTVPSFLTSAGPVIGASGTIDILLGLGSLPTTHGGTGLKTIGAANTVLTSSGTSVSWAPVSTLVNSNIGAATGISLSLNSVTSVLSAFVTYNISPNNTEVEISYSPTLNLFVATGRNTPSISTSTDGITWTTRTSPHTSPIYFANIWIPELNLFMIGGIAATPVVATSPDGITWTNRTLPGGGGWVFRGAWNGSLLVCGSQNGFYTYDTKS